MTNRIVRIQLLIALGASAVACAFGWRAAYSVLLGGTVSMVSNWYFAAKVFGAEGAGAAPPAEVTRLYFAELIKLALAAVMLGVILVVVEHVNEIALIVGFLLAYVGGAVLLAVEPAAQP